MAAEPANRPCAVRVTRGFGRTTVNLPVLVHWVSVAWVKSSRLSARKMYQKVLWRWQVGHLVVMALPRWRKQPR